MFVVRSESNPSQAICTPKTTQISASRSVISTRREYVRLHSRVLPVETGRRTASAVTATTASPRRAAVVRHRDAAARPHPDVLPGAVERDRAPRATGLHPIGVVVVAGVTPDAGIVSICTPSHESVPMRASVYSVSFTASARTPSIGTVTHAPVPVRHCSSSAHATSVVLSPRKASSGSSHGEGTTASPSTSPWSVTPAPAAPAVPSTQVTPSSVLVRTSVAHSSPTPTSTDRPSAVARSDPTVRTSSPRATGDHSCPPSVVCSSTVSETSQVVLEARHASRPSTADSMWRVDTPSAVGPADAVADGPGVAGADALEPNVGTGPASPRASGAVRASASPTRTTSTTTSATTTSAIPISVVRGSSLPRLRIPRRWLIPRPPSAVRAADHAELAAGLPRRLGGLLGRFLFVEAVPVAVPVAAVAVRTGPLTGIIVMTKPAIGAPTFSSDATAAASWPLWVLPDATARIARTPSSTGSRRR